MGKGVDFNLSFLSTDVDECITDVDNCHFNAFCNDTIGSFFCTCSLGYDGNGVNCTSKYNYILYT